MATEEAQKQVILATGGYDHAIHFWQAHSGIRQSSVQHASSQVNALEITPNRLLLAVAGFQHVKMYDIYSNNPNPVVHYEGIPKNFTSLGFVDDGKWMVTGSEDNMARIWDLRSRTLQCQKFFPTGAPVNTLCIHPNQTEVFIGDQSGTICIWDLRAESDNNRKPFFKIPENHVSIQSLHIDPEGTFMSAVDNKGYCHVFMLSQANQEKSQTYAVKYLKFKAHDTYALKCKFSPDSTFLVTSSADCSAKVWRTADLNLLENPDDSATRLASPEWKKTQTNPMVELRDNNQRWVWDVAFSADSQYLFTASSDNVARLWSISKGDVKREYTGHSKALTSLAFRDGG